jgi:hypothetical protein
VIGPNQLAIRAAPPIDLQSIDCYRVILEKKAVFSGTSFDFGTGSFSGSGPIFGTFAALPQPSNSINGKKLVITLDGTNLGIGSHTVTITGTSYSSATTETITFASSGVQQTVEFWKTIDSIDISVEVDDPVYPAAAIQIVEAVPLTQSENDGINAEVYSYDNGVITFRIAGTDNDFILSSGYYLLDYPSPISIQMADKGRLIIGADVSGVYRGEAIIEAPSFYSSTLEDVRIGESSDILNQTLLHNSPFPPAKMPEATLLLDFDEHVKDITGIYPAFLSQFKTASRSLNSAFEDALYVDRRIVLDNARELVGPRRGTIEFFLSPLLDTYYDENEYRFIMDITSLKSIDTVSTTSNTIILPFKARSVNRVYLKGDDTRENLLGPRSLLSDGRTIRLPSRLPAQRTAVTVEYTPIDFEGDRISLYLDGYNNVNFAITANNITRVISREIDWKRDSWHRIMATWDVSNIDNFDQMRLFLDGTENNIVTWGSPGFIWGGGHVWGTSATGVTGSQALIDDINLVDEFSVINIGSDFSGSQQYLMKMDNLRFSSIARQPVRIGALDYDLVWNDNLGAVSPVIPDAFTKGLFDFNRSDSESDRLANLISTEGSLYSIGVEIDDGFNKILSSERSREALLSIYQKIKPAHMRLFSKFKQEI